MSLHIRRRLVAALGLALLGVIAAAAPASAAPRDTTPPPAPPHLQVTFVTFSSVSFAWGDVFDPDAVRYEVSTGSRTEMPRGTSHYFGDLRSEATHTVSVRAIDRAGNRSEAASRTFTTPRRPDGPPTVPANLRPVFANGVLDAIEWDASTNGTEISYQLYNGPEEFGSAWATGLTRVTVWELVSIQCLDRGGLYTFTVKAFSAGRHVSGHSASLTVKIPPEYTRN